MCSAHSSLCWGSPAASGPVAALLPPLGWLKLEGGSAGVCILFFVGCPHNRRAAPSCFGVSVAALGWGCGILQESPQNHGCQRGWDQWGGGCLWGTSPQTGVDEGSPTPPSLPTDPAHPPSPRRMLWGRCRWPQCPLLYLEPPFPSLGAVLGTLSHPRTVICRIYRPLCRVPCPTLGCPSPSGGCPQPRTWGCFLSPTWGKRGDSALKGRCQPRGGPAAPRPPGCPPFPVSVLSPTWAALRVPPCAPRARPARRSGGSGGAEPRHHRPFLPPLPPPPPPFLPHGPPPPGRRPHSPHQLPQTPSGFYRVLGGVPCTPRLSRDPIELPRRSTPPQYPMGHHTPSGFPCSPIHL